MSETRDEEALRHYGVQALVALQSVGITPDLTKTHTAWIVTLEPDGPQAERGGRRAVSENFREFLEIRSPEGPHA